MTKTSKAAKKPNAIQSEADLALVKKWMQRLEDAKSKQKTIFDIAKANYEIYYAKTSADQRAKSPWKSNVFLPLLPGKARDIKAKLSVIDPRFRAIPADAWELDDTGELNFRSDVLAKALKVTKKLNMEYVNYSPTGGLPPRASVDFATTDAIVAGWGLALAPLETYKKVYTTYEALKDEDGADTAYVDKEKAIRKELLRTRTKLEPLDIFRVYISPKAKSWEKPYWIMHEREETYSSLVKCNSDQGEMVYSIPAGLENAKGDVTKNDYSAVREVALGYGQDGADNKDDSLEVFNVYDCYDAENNKFYTFIEAKIPDSTDKWTKIREMDNPYNHGLIPIVPFHVKRRPNSPWGESFFEIAKDVQFAYNASYNQFADNATLAGETMAIMDKNAIVGDFEVAPGATLEYDSLNGEKPEPWKFTDPNPAVLNARNEILEKNAENGTVPQYTSGQVDSSMDKTNGTKGGIEMLMEAANDKLSEMLRNLKSSLLLYGYMSLHNAQQYQNYIEVLDLPDMSASGQQKLARGEKAKADFITPVELQDAYDLTIDDESLLPMTKTEKRQLFKDFVGTLLEFQKASIEQSGAFDTPEDLMRLDWDDLAKEVGNQYSEVNAPAFIKPFISREELAQKKMDDAAVDQSAKDGAAQIAQENNPDAEVNQDPNGLQVQHQQRELINFKDLPSDSKNPVLESLGYPASQIVEEDAAAELAEYKAVQLDTQVKEQMINAAASGKIDPIELAKFIKK